MYIYNFDEYNKNFNSKQFVNDKCFYNFYLSDIRKNIKKIAINNISSLDSILNLNIMNQIFIILEKAHINSMLDMDCFLGALIEPTNKETICKLSIEIQRVMFNCSSLLLDGSNLSIKEEELHKFFESLTNVECFVTSLR